MVGNASSSMSSSSKKIISGVPAPILFYGDLVMNLQEYVEAIVNEELIKEEKVARKSLVSREPGYKKIKNDFKVAYDKKNNDITYKVAGKSAKIAQSLEYGPPAKSLLRHEVLEGSKRLSSNINQRFDKLTGKTTL